MRALRSCRLQLLASVPAVVLGKFRAVDCAFDQGCEGIHVGFWAWPGVRLRGAEALHVKPADLLVGFGVVAHAVLVAGKPGLRVPAGRSQLPSQHVGADQYPIIITSVTESVAGCRGPADSGSVRRRAAVRV